MIKQRKLLSNLWLTFLGRKLVIDKFEILKEEIKVVNHETMFCLLTYSILLDLITLL